MKFRALNFTQRRLEAPLKIWQPRFNFPPECPASTVLQLALQSYFPRSPGPLGSICEAQGIVKNRIASFIEVLCLQFTQVQSETE